MITNKQKIFEKACTEGYTEVVRVLLKDKSVDPSADNNCAIRWANYNRHTEIVNLLKERGCVL